MELLGMENPAAVVGETRCGPEYAITYSWLITGK
jgi:hypothetical protein